jgi:hypothetical protein
MFSFRRAGPAPAAHMEKAAVGPFPHAGIGSTAADYLGKIDSATPGF